MNSKKLLTTFLIFLSASIFAQTSDPYKPDSGKPKDIKGMKLVWNEEFNYSGKPDSTFWRYEKGFVRNQEIQWYQPDNANCANGILLIEGRREQFSNPQYLLLNLALGLNGDDPEKTNFPIKFEVDYVRVYQTLNND